MDPAAFNASALIERLARGPAVFAALFDAFVTEDLAWRPDQGSWSALEICCHLADEEAEDFRARVRSTLEDPRRDWSPIDPAGWAVERGYRERDFAGEWSRFRRERDDSIAWLRSLGDPRWDNERVHPKFGGMRAGELLASWAAHDVLHQRQLVRRLYQITRRDAGPFDVGYAGSW